MGSVVTVDGLEMFPLIVIGGQKTREEKTKE